MTNITKITRLSAIIAMVLFASCGSNPTPPAASADLAQTGPVSVHGGLPQDVLKCCTVSEDTFKTWFADNKPAPNGMVTNPNAVTLVHDTNCQFYQYAQRMFLWINSPLNSGQPNGLRVFQSQAFFDVTPAEGTGGRRNFVSHGGEGYLPRLATHITQAGAHKLPVFLDKNKVPYEVVRPAERGKIMVADSKSGKSTEVSRIE